MSDSFFKVVLIFLYAGMFCSMLLLCSDFLDAVKVNSVSQKQAAWTQVYWVRRGQLMAEKDWQEKWEALHFVEYCRQLQAPIPAKDPRDTQ